MSSTHTVSSERWTLLRTHDGRFRLSSAAVEAFLVDAMLRWTIGEMKLRPCAGPREAEDKRREAAGWRKVASRRKGETFVEWVPRMLDLWDLRMVKRRKERRRRRKGTYCLTGVPRGSERRLNGLNHISFIHTHAVCPSPPQLPFADWLEHVTNYAQPFHHFSTLDPRSISIYPSLYDPTNRWFAVESLCSSSPVFGRGRGINLAKSEGWTIDAEW